MKGFVFIAGCILLLSCGNKHKLKDHVSSNEHAGLERACIENIIEKDSELGKIRNFNCEEMPMSEAINRYVKKLNSLDFSSCSKEFTAAFQKHIEAWLSFTQVSDRYPNLRGEMHDVFAEIEKSTDSLEFRRLEKQIWDSWKEVEDAIE